MEFRKEYTVRLPLALAQLYSRAHNAKSARDRHDLTYFLFEAMVRMAVTPLVMKYLEEIEEGQVRVPELDRRLTCLARPSAGHWTGLLRELSRCFGERVDAGAHPLGHLWKQLHTQRRDLPDTLALFRRIKHGPDGQPASDQSVSLLNLFEALTPYRNKVIGHGGVRDADFYETEVGPLLFPAANEVLADGVFDLLGPPGSRLVSINEIRQIDRDQYEVGLREVVGLQGDRRAPLRISEAQKASLVPNSLGVLWPGRTLPMRLDPLLLYRESELSDELWFLNSVPDGRFVEYLNYASSKTEQNRPLAASMAQLLGRITGQAVSDSELGRLGDLSQSDARARGMAGDEPLATTGRVLGDYEILGELGRGGMGLVYLARQLSLGRVLALKLLPPSLQGDEVALARFRREIRLLAGCDDPHVIKILAAGNLPDGQPYYAMEYVPGCDLEQVWQEISGAPGRTADLSGSRWSQAIRSASNKRRADAANRSKGSTRGNAGSDPGTASRGGAASDPPVEPVPDWFRPLPELPDVASDPGGYVRRVVQLVHDAADALAVLHAQDVIHRDVKPSNLMLTPDGSRIVLMDFGLAKAETTGLTRQGGDFLGTMRYAAPEQLAAASMNVGKPADVRALGVVLWELLTRQRLFGEAHDASELAPRVLNDDVPRLRSIDPSLSRDLEAIVARATERRVSDRIPNAGVLATYLQMYLNSQPLPIRTPGLGELATRWARKNARTLTAAAAILVVAAIGIFALQKRSEARLHETRIRGLVDTLVNIEPSGFLEIAAQPDANDPLAQSMFASLLDTSATTDAERRRQLNARLATVARDERQVEPLVEELLTGKLAYFVPVREQLRRYSSTLTGRFWTVMREETAESQRRLRAAMALAAYAPDSPLWTSADFVFIAEQLVAVSPVFLGEYRDLMRPVADRLVPPLSVIFRDPERGELVKTLSTALLADYASDDAESLTELVVAADPASDKTLFPLLQPHQAAAVTKMEAILEQRLQPDWKDGPLDPGWTEPSAETRARIESAHGIVGERYAFCQDMPWNTFLEVVESLRASGYRPTRVRPHQLLLASGEERGLTPEEGAAVAAVWIRDGMKWELQTAVSRDELPAPDVDSVRDGMLLADLVPLPTPDPAAEPRFIALWCASAVTDEQRRVLIDLSETRLTQEHARLAELGFSQNTISARVNPEGERLYSAIFSSTGAPSELRPAYAGFELFHMPQWDIAIFPEIQRYPKSEFRIASSWRGGSGRELRVFIPVADKLWTEVSPEGGTFSFTEVGSGDRTVDLLDPAREIRIRLGPESAEFAVKDGPLRPWKTGTWVDINECPEFRRHVAFDEEIARATFVRLMPHADVILLAWEGKHTDALALLNEARDASELSTHDRFSWACSAAISAQQPDLEAPTREPYIELAISLLGKAIEGGFSDGVLLRTDFRLAILRTDSRFSQLLEQLKAPVPPPQYAGVFQSDVEFESRLFQAAPGEDLMPQLRLLLADGWRPYTISAGSTLSSATSPGGENLAGSGNSAASCFCTVVLHCPLVPDADREQLAIRQAAAATVLLRLNAAERVWPLLKDQPDPRVRSYLLNRLSQYGVDPAALIAQLAAESDVSRRRSLILGIGEFARAGLLSMDQHAAMVVDVAERYADDPDSGVHGAAEWTLRQLGAEDRIAEIRASFSTGQVIGDRHWYVTRTGGAPSPRSESPLAAHGLTFAIVDAGEEFLMGSPVSEAERLGGPAGKEEVRHRRRIGRQYAISQHEVTVAQFRAFRREHDFNRAYAREEDAPANRISWYDAAAFCNWLSKQEGIPEDQWCYDPQQEFGDGMTMPADYLQRSGYRLPSEAEWEYACRAGTATARFYGETETLLGEFGWYSKTSGDKWMLPVGTLRPNSLGLFDMQGNALEWCQDRPLFYDTDVRELRDTEQLEELDNSRDRVLRGGSFNTNLAPFVRSAVRSSLRPDLRNTVNGFRVARTIR